MTIPVEACPDDVIIQITVHFSTKRAGSHPGIFLDAVIEAVSFRVAGCVDRRSQLPAEPHLGSGIGVRIGLDYPATCVAADDHSTDW